jgi:hypothetical protein
MFGARVTKSAGLSKKEFAGRQRAAHQREAGVLSSPEKSRTNRDEVPANRDRQGSARSDRGEDGRDHFKLARRV